MDIRFLNPLFYLCSVLALNACDDGSQIVSQSPLQAPQINWYEQGQTDIQNAISAYEKITNRMGSAKNIILFVGDGMGISTVTAARILDGQRKGHSGEENQLSFGQFPFSGLSKTYNVDAQTPDSAGTMTALITGVKTDAGILGINEKVKRGDCNTVAGNELVTALELAELAGMSTGIVTTARVTHATPAANYAKSADRNWEDISDMPQKAIDDGCKDIAQQLIDFESNLKRRFPTADVSGIEVIMGGGRRHFLPKDKQANSADAVSEVEGNRTDGVNLIEQWQALYPDGLYVMDAAGFANINLNKTQHLLGLFNESHMRYETDRANDKAGEPSLSEMTKAAIEMLGKNPNGFFLNVEAGRIDHGHHAGNAYNALTDAIELSHAVQTALENTNLEETLIIVTADHSHVFTMAGYPKRGNPILGKVVNVGENAPAMANDGRPYTTLGYMNGRGFHDLHTHTDANEVYDEGIVTGRHLTNHVDTQASGYHQEALVPLSSETHGGEDVGIYAIGPGAHLVSGVHEQNYIFHVMNHAGGLTQKAMPYLTQK